MLQSSIANHVLVRRIAGLLLAVAAFSQNHGRFADSRFVSDKFEFSLLTPRGWAVERIGDVPMFFSIDPGNSYPVIQLPTGGATINMDVVSRTPRAGSSPKWLRTLRDYAEAIGRAGGATDPALSPIAFPPESGISEALVVSWDRETLSPPNKSITQ